MGIFDFLKGNGRAAKQKDNLAEEIRIHLRDGLRGRLEDPRVSFKDGLATLYGTADSQATKEKAVLMAGNIQGVERVDDDNITVATPEPAPPAPRFYTIEKGDSLSKIAKANYGDANKWPALFEANREVIEDPNKIYPGQTIRLPEDV